VRLSLLSLGLFTGFLQAGNLEPKDMPLSFDNRPAGSVYLGSWQPVDCEDTRLFELNRWSEVTLQRMTGGATAPKAHAKPAAPPAGSSNSVRPAKTPKRFAVSNRVRSSGI
jgi:hypothetical protein